jgi:hypothetical protein
MSSQYPHVMLQVDNYKMIIHTMINLHSTQIIQ